jgi:putative colanic acid biosynthesis UDP-glucose lipid carrier transferase
VIRQAVENDNRVTRVGHFLRRSSLDELPQLFNVLSGEMSLVGPRPHALAHNRFYSQLFDDYAIRHKVKPGITGLAQVQGWRGNSEDPALMAARAAADIEYIENWSIWSDVRILLLTPFVMLFQKSAY